jgi:hypothetical protein
MRFIPPLRKPVLWDIAVAVWNVLCKRFTDDSVVY